MHDSRVDDQHDGREVSRVRALLGLSGGVDAQALKPVSVCLSKRAAMTVPSSLMLLQTPQLCLFKLVRTFMPTRTVVSNSVWL